MGVKDSFQAASVLVKFGFFLTFAANVCSWISFTTTSWIHIPTADSTLHVGLWRQCPEKPLAPCNVMDGSGDGTLNVVQACAIFGFVALNAAFVLLVLVIFGPSCKGDSEGTLASAILLFISGACWVLAVIIFAIEYDYKNRRFHFSFILAIIATIIAVIAGVVVIITRCGNSGVAPS